MDSPRPKQVEIHVRSGIPDTMRGNMWMRLANCDEMEMLELYKTLISKECSSDDVIRRDIHRTFPANEFFQSGNGQELLFKICHAYAIYDVDVGYLQGISFITAALLLQVCMYVYAVIVQCRIFYKIIFKLLTDAGRTSLLFVGEDNVWPYKSSQFVFE